MERGAEEILEALKKKRELRSYLTVKTGDTKRKE